MDDHEIASNRALAGAQRAAYYAGIVARTAEEESQPTWNAIKVVLYGLDEVLRAEVATRRAWEGLDYPRTPEQAALHEKADRYARSAAGSRVKAIYAALNVVRAFEWWVGGPQADDAASRLGKILQASRLTF